MEPTDAQKAAGNYKKDHRFLHGMRLSVETPRGGVRRGVGRDGEPWEAVMPHDYGYIRGSKGKDKDHVDAFIGPDAAEDHPVHVIDQDDDAGNFDEHKVMLGFPDANAAYAAYHEAYPAGHNGFGGITALPMSEFKKWIYRGREGGKRKRIRELVKYAAGGSVTVPDVVEPEGDCGCGGKPELAGGGSVLKALIEGAPKLKDQLAGAVRKAANANREVHVVGSDETGASMRTVGDENGVKLDKEAVDSYGRMPGAITDFHTHPPRADFAQVTPSHEDLEMWTQAFGGRDGKKTTTLIVQPPIVGRNANDFSLPERYGQGNRFSTSTPSRTLDPRRYGDAVRELQFRLGRSGAVQDLFGAGANSGDVLEEFAPLLLQQHYGDMGLGESRIAMPRTREIGDEFRSGDEVLRALGDPVKAFLKQKGYAEGGAVEDRPFIGYRGRRAERNNDRAGAREMPLQALRGALTGTLGFGGDIEGLGRTIANLVGADVDPTPVLPTSDFYSDALPLKPTSAAGRAAAGAGQLAGVPLSSVALGGLRAVSRAAPSVRGALSKMAENAMAPRTLNPQAGAVKMPGGNWQPGVDDEFLKNVYGARGYATGGTVPGQESVGLGTFAQGPGGGAATQPAGGSGWGFAGQAAPGAVTNAPSPAAPYAGTILGNNLRLNGALPDVSASSKAPSYDLTTPDGLMNPMLQATLHAADAGGMLMGNKAFLGQDWDPAKYSRRDVQRAGSGDNIDYAPESYISGYNLDPLLSLAKGVGYDTSKYNLDPARQDAPGGKGILQLNQDLNDHLKDYATIYGMSSGWDGSIGKPRSSAGTLYRNVSGVLKPVTDPVSYTTREKGNWFQENPLATQALLSAASIFTGGLAAGAGAGAGAAGGTGWGSALANSAGYGAQWSALPGWGQAAIQSGAQGALSSAIQGGNPVTGAVTGALTSGAGSFGGNVAGDAFGQSYAGLGRTLGSMGARYALSSSR